MRSIVPQSSPLSTTPAPTCGTIRGSVSCGSIAHLIIGVSMPCCGFQMTHPVCLECYEWPFNRTGRCVQCGERNVTALISEPVRIGGSRV